MGKGRPSAKNFKNKRAEDDEDYEAPNMTQNSNAGMMPPSDSEDEEEEAPAAVKSKPAGQNPNAGMMPPSDSEDEEDEEPAPAKAEAQAEEKVVVRPAVFVEKSEKEIAAEMEKLAMAAARIAKEGFDRFAKEGKPTVRDAKAPGAS
eukprot:gene13610-16091_t